MSNLNPREKSFVENYCGEARFNGTAAAILAGYSEKTARSKASQLLTKVNIQDAISEFMNKATKKALVTTEDIVKELWSLGKDAETESVRHSALKTLTDFTGGFDNNRQKVDNTHTIKDSGEHEW